MTENVKAGAQVSNICGKDFVEAIINGMYDWVRVLDRNDRMIYLNDSLAEALGPDAIGKKCYTLMGRDKPCELCTARKAVFDGVPHQKEEIIKGKTYSVMSSPIKDKSGEIIAVVEVLRDITELKKLQRRITSQNEKLRTDLELARKLQCSLLPKNLLQDKIKYSFTYKPCDALGGDFFDIFAIDSSHIGVYIADVSGHGVAASMLTVFLRSSINKKLLSPAAALTELYREFNAAGFDGELYITMFYAIIDLKDGNIVYSNAGHNASPVVFSENRLELLRSAGIPISSWMEDPQYTDNSLAIQKKDRIFLYTDGIIELRSSTGEQYGDQRLLDILLSESPSPQETLDRLAAGAAEFAGLQSPSDIPDDITMVLLELV